MNEITSCNKNYNNWHFWLNYMNFKIKLKSYDSDNCFSLI